MTERMYTMTVTEGEWRWVMMQAQRKSAPLGLRFALESATLVARPKSSADRRGD